MKWTTKPRKADYREGTPSQLLEVILKGDWKGRKYVRYNGMDNGGWTCHVSTNHGRYPSENIVANNLFLYGTKAEHRELERLLEPYMKVFPREYQDERLAGHSTQCHECGFCMDDIEFGDFCVMDNHISDRAREIWIGGGF